MDRMNDEAVGRERDQRSARPPFAGSRFQQNPEVPLEIAGDKPRDREVRHAQPVSKDPLQVLRRHQGERAVADEQQPGPARVEGGEVGGERRLGQATVPPHDLGRDPMLRDEGASG